MERKWWRAPPWRAVLLWSTALSLVLWGAPVRADAGGAAPKPIPGGLGRFPGAPDGVGIHAWPSGTSPTTGIINEPSTITDFNGVVAVNDIRGTGEETDTRTGIKYPVAYALDMRILKGRYVGADGIEYQGIFGFLWMDIYPGRQLAPGAAQSHDFNPGVASNGVFWTIAIPAEAGVADPVAGTATYTQTDLAIGDYTQLGNGAMNGPHRPAKVSFTITWSPGPDPKHLHVHDTTNGFGGDFIQGVSTASWSASGEGFTFTSTPGETSTTAIAYVGTEQNGRFFTP